MEVAPDLYLSQALPQVSRALCLSSMWGQRTLSCEGFNGPRVPDLTCL